MAARRLEHIQDATGHTAGRVVGGWIVPCVGIEYLPALHQDAKTLHARREGGPSGVGVSGGQIVPQGLLFEGQLGLGLPRPARSDMAGA